MSRYLVTGGAGRLGRSVVTVLAEAGHDVISVDRAEVPGLPGVQRVHDLADIETTTRLFAEQPLDGIVHLAAISVPFSAPEAEIFRTNTSLAFTVLEAAQAARVPAVLISSSPTVIGYGAPAGWEASELPITERHPLAPWNAYALAKQSIEQLVASRIRGGTAARLGLFRPCYVIAPEEWHGAPTQQGHTVRDRLDDEELAAVSLFNYLDARDAGEFALAWLDRADVIPNGSVFFVGAADSFLRGPVGPALARLVPGTERLAGTLPPQAPVFSSEKAERLLGWRARRSWRTELNTAESKTAESNTAQSNRAESNRAESNRADSNVAQAKGVEPERLDSEDIADTRQGSATQREIA